MAIIEQSVVTILQYLSNSELQFPHFQRPYKWTTKNVIQLIDDINRFKGVTPYRIGTIVIFKNNEGYQIVDGQQRTISFLLLLKAIMLNKHESLNNEELRERLFVLNEKVIKPVFQSEISKKNIQLNYKEIEFRIVNAEEDFIEFFLNKCQITYFVIDDISEAFQFFDSQNARGKDLEPHDLLKAFHLRELNTAKNYTNQDDTQLVETWELMDTRELGSIFADFLYRVKGWAKGNSARYFSKKDTIMFKGINLQTIEDYPHTKIYSIADEFTRDARLKGNADFPFQLDQTIINGRYFFEMITHYKNLYDALESKLEVVTGVAKDIIIVINNYEGMHRMGDRYVRMLFNCALLNYIDKFGYKDLSKAIEKIFIWAYSIRLTYQSLQLASVDNYVLKEINLFRKIREAIYKEDILNMSIPVIEDDYESKKTKKIKGMFITMKYYVKRT
ncbi:hypothetical protein ASE92_06515 [Pedobacter sp. Leaf41]|uniref:DUF262 domain-containing protein n=1 Tax=Pedobacter sp. Leaf41 TaxID=1736218 RepID=UPI00070247CD|nr:DUF262 domain-containing protein [Pedobacter sp. Leaf41]KQN35794.1 hypothetical protein ASE92_06515 [Pedobacter sp. Leaf41]